MTKGLSVKRKDIIRSLEEGMWLEKKSANVKEGDEVRVFIDHSLPMMDDGIGKVIIKKIVNRKGADGKKKKKFIFCKMIV